MSNPQKLSLSRGDTHRRSNQSILFPFLDLIHDLRLPKPTPTPWRMIARILEKDHDCRVSHVALQQFYKRHIAINPQTPSSSMPIPDMGLSLGNSSLFQERLTRVREAKKKMKEKQELIEEPKKLLTAADLHYTPKESKEE